jgi:hypothetical protein
MTVPCRDTTYAHDGIQLRRLRVLPQAGILGEHAVRDGAWIATRLPPWIQ